MRMIKKLLLGVMLSGVLVVASFAGKMGGKAAMMKDPDCEPHMYQAKMMKAFMQAQGMPEMINTKGGTIHLVTSKTPEGAKQIQTAAKQFDKTMMSLMKKDDLKVCQECAPMFEAMKGHKMDAEVVTIKHGMMWVAMSEDPATIKMLHDMTDMQMKKMSTMTPK